MKLLDLFSGIGGFSLAAEWAGIETVAFCEREPFCQMVLRKHWPNVPIVGDIHDLRGDEFGAVDIVSGGFPCQPFSVAGKRAGEDDDRHLWPEMLRVIQKSRPTWVLGENVFGIVSLALDQVLSDLEGIGYATQAFIIPACAVNAQHRRDREWIVANAESERCEKRCCSRRDGAKLSEFDGLFKGHATSERLPNWAKGQMEEPPALAMPKRPVGGSTTPRLLRMVYGIPHRVDRIKSLGNAIVPQVALQFFREIVKTERG